jgi:hypothetical protein
VGSLRPSINANINITRDKLSPAWGDIFIATTFSNIIKILEITSMSAAIFIRSFFPETDLK